MKKNDKQIIPHEEVLVPQFILCDGSGKTLTEKMNEKKLKELRGIMVENILKEYYVEEQMSIDKFCEQYKR